MFLKLPLFSVNKVSIYLIYRLSGEHIVCLHYDDLLSLVLLKVLTQPLLVNIIQRVGVDPQQVGLLLNSGQEQILYFWHRSIGLYKNYKINTQQSISTNRFFLTQRKYLFIWLFSSLVYIYIALSDCYWNWPEFEKSREREGHHHQGGADDRVGVSRYKPPPPGKWENISTKLRCWLLPIKEILHALRESIARLLQSHHHPGLWSAGILK